MVDPTEKDPRFHRNKGGPIRSVSSSWHGWHETRAEDTTLKRSSPSRVCCPSLNLIVATASCAHPDREEIEQAFVTWNSPVRISKDYGVSRDSVYRHAHALGLMAKRRRNVSSALERIIEQAGEVEASAAAVVSAVAAYA